MTSPTRPVLRWHGGKWLLAPWIISHFPPHRVYVEPFGGAGSVLMRKDRAYAEVWNDLDGEVVNLFRVLRSDRADALIEAVWLTPFARDEFDEAYEKTDDPVERARRMIVRSYMGFGGGLAVNFRSTGFRADSQKRGSTPAHDWERFPPALAAIASRLRGVVIENRDAALIMADHDGADRLHYVDPPYVHDTRSGKSVQGQPYHAYAHELTDEDHGQLLKALKALTGMVVLSGYPSTLYDGALAGWRRVERKALADGARERTEVLWLNPACCAALDRQHLPLLEGAT